jgi:hypothetical protein
MAEPTIVIHNATQGDLKMQVGNHHYFVYLTTVQKDRDYTMPVDFNATYQEYLMGEDSNGKKLIVSTDDCCDYKSITIKEKNGQFDVQKVPRRAVATPESANYSNEQTSSAAAGGKKPKANWRFWMNKK